eukprot:tig00000093_g3533.t1
MEVEPAQPAEQAPLGGADFDGEADESLCSLWHGLPLGLQAAVLEHLPLKALLDARLVCKEWRCAVDYVLPAALRRFWARHRALAPARVREALSPFEETISPTWENILEWKVPTKFFFNLIEEGRPRHKVPFTLPSDWTGQKIIVCQPAHLRAIVYSHRVQKLGVWQMRPQKDESMAFVLEGTVPVPPIICLGFTPSGRHLIGRCARQLLVWDAARILEPPRSLPLPLILRKGDGDNRCESRNHVYLPVEFSEFLAGHGIPLPADWSGARAAAAPQGSEAVAPPPPPPPAPGSRTDDSARPAPPSPPSSPEPSSRTASEGCSVEVPVPQGIADKIPGFERVADWVTRDPLSPGNLLLSDRYAVLFVPAQRFVAAPAQLYDAEPGTAFLPVEPPPPDIAPALLRADPPPPPPEALERRRYLRERELQEYRARRAEAHFGFDGFHPHCCMYSHPPRRARDRDFEREHMEWEEHEQEFESEREQERDWDRERTTRSRLRSASARQAAAPASDSSAEKRDEVVVEDPMPLCPEEGAAEPLPEQAAAAAAPAAPAAASSSAPRRRRRGATSWTSTYAGGCPAAAGAATAASSRSAPSARWAAAAARTSRDALEAAEARDRAELVAAELMARERRRRDREAALAARALEGTGRLPGPGCPRRQLRGPRRDGGLSRRGGGPRDGPRCRRRRAAAAAAARLPSAGEPAPEAPEVLEPADAEAAQPAGAEATAPAAEAKGDEAQAQAPAEKEVAEPPKASRKRKTISGTRLTGVCSSAPCRLLAVDLTDGRLIWSPALETEERPLEACRTASIDEEGTVRVCSWRLPSRDFVEVSWRVAAPDTPVEIRVVRAAPVVLSPPPRVFLARPAPALGRGPSLPPDLSQAAGSSSEWSLAPASSSAPAPAPPPPPPLQSSSPYIHDLRASVVWASLDDRWKYVLNMSNGNVNSAPAAAAPANGSQSEAQAPMPSRAPVPYVAQCESRHCVFRLEAGTGLLVVIEKTSQRVLLSSKMLCAVHEPRLPCCMSASEDGTRVAIVYQNGSEFLVRIFIVPV